ncbi:hypothetical protein [Endozoicomonas ascidiicola]|uniref:hypothetical protein n=1 Tax=Endozoicomonas ascidiicola TaxID=1698521 RepID=UPI00082976AC|nr:hypothetical protein [Endozoicomonas ascidiicola]
MDNVTGLRPVGSPDNTLTRKRGRKVVQNRGSNERLRPSASPVDTFIASGKAPDVSSNLLQLSEALKSVNPMLGKYALAQKAEQQDAQASLEKEQMQKLRYYTELFMKDKESGAVNQAQVKELLPELVPAVAARVAQATGEKESKTWLSGRIQAILENDELRLDSQARDSEIQAIRSEALEQIGENEFYGAGFLNQMDRSLNEFSSTWMRETAAYQEDLQKESLASHVLDTLRNDGDLVQKDQEWQDSSSLNHAERNEVIINAVVGEAISTLDHTLLDKIPDRFLNATSKTEIAKAKMDINNGLYTQYVQQERLKTDSYKASVREGKVSVLDLAAQGQPVNPLDFRGQPEVYQFATQLANQPTVNPVASQGKARRLRSGLMMGATNGDFAGAMGGEFALQLFNDEMSEGTLIELVSSAEGINPADKVQLIKEIPVLMEGVNFVRDPDFNTYFEDNVGGDAKVYAGSAMGGLLSQAGYNVMGETRKAYNTSIRQSVMQYIEDKGEIPRNRLEIMDKALDAAKQRLTTIQKTAVELAKDEFGKITPNQSQANQPQPKQPQTPFDASGNLILPNGQTIKVMEK